MEPIKVGFMTESWNVKNKINEESSSIDIKGSVEHTMRQIMANVSVIAGRFGAETATNFVYELKKAVDELQLKNPDEETDIDERPYAVASGKI